MRGCGVCLQARLFTDLVVSELEAEESVREQEMAQMRAQAIQRQQSHQALQRKRSKQKQAQQKSKTELAQPTPSTAGGDGQTEHKATDAPHVIDL